MLASSLFGKVINRKRAGSDHSRPAPSYSSRLLFVPYAADLKASFPQESSNADNAVAASKDITFLLIS